MTLSLIIRHDESGHTQVLLRYPGGDDDEAFWTLPPFTSPLAPSDLNDLRFYLEDYAQIPAGEFLARGELVEKKLLSRWGNGLYAAAFGEDEMRYEAYVTVRDAAGRGEPVEVVISSDNARFFGLPWELLKAPDDSAPLSTQVERFDRSLSVHEAPRSFADSSNGFRVLMVIARPDGQKDASFQTIARPLFEHLARNDGLVKIDVLRPPTFAEFLSCLTAAKGAGAFCHAVHFDGHGVFRALANQDENTSETQQGFVQFEQDAGGDGLINAKSFAGALIAAGVPLVILNACQSAAVEAANASTGPEASIATRLLQEGGTCVVAKTHGVYVVAVVAIMATFYEALFAGKCIDEAVNIGRKALREDRNSLRQSLKGEIKLQDWMLPVHYTCATLRLLVAARLQTASPSDVAVQAFAGAHATESEKGADSLSTADTFFGRDAECFGLERAIRTHSVALVYGMGGSGKTKLAKAFACGLLLVSNGLDDPRLVFVHKFLPGRPAFGLHTILGDIIAQLDNADLYLILKATDKTLHKC